MNINIQHFLLVFIPAFFGIVCHEVAHGYVAYLLGDPTAKNAGRLTLNPLKHLDPAGTTVFIGTALFSPLTFGWAKPIPVHFRYFKHVRRDMALVSFAGPFANFVVAFLCLFIVLVVEMRPPSEFLSLVRESAQYGAIANIYLAWFNLLPIPPLDGGHIVECLLPPPLAQQFARIEKFGLFFLLAVLYLGFGSVLFRSVFGPTLQLLYALASPLAGLWSLLF